VTAQAGGRRIAVILEYDGSAFNGSQIQDEAPTVQDALETAIGRLTGLRSRAAFAGRTDAGVHARGQVAAFDTDSALPIETFVGGLNAHLPEQAAVRGALEVESDFDPRRHAASRIYRYTVYNARPRSPLYRDQAWHVPTPLDLPAMREAGALLVGEHNFASFTRDEGRPTVRCVRRFAVLAKPPLLDIEMEANAFLRQQMRRTVGALVEVGSERLDLAGFRRFIEQPELATAGPLAPAHGLCLEQVVYPGLDLMADNTL